MKTYMKMYYLWNLVGAALAVYFGYVLQHPIPTLLVLILVFCPTVDYYFIKKRNLFKGSHLILKYPFWGYRRKLLFGE